MSNDRQREMTEKQKAEKLKQEEQQRPESNR